MGIHGYTFVSAKGRRTVVVHDFRHKEYPMMAGTHVTYTWNGNGGWVRGPVVRVGVITRDKARACRQFHNLKSV